MKEADMENPEQHRSERYYRRHGMVTRPVHLAPEEAEAIRQAAFHAHVSQQQWMREVLTGLRAVPPPGTAITGYEPGPPVKLTQTA